MTEQAVSTEIARLFERLTGQEALDLEVKAARGGLPHSVWPTISAFANTRGGWVVLGIAERKETLVIDGVARPGELLQQISDQIRNPQRISYPISGSIDLTVERVDDRDIVVIRVPPAPRRERPVYVNGNPYAGTYVRQHTGDYRCTRPEVDRMMREASDLAADQVVLTGYDWADLDRDAFARYRRRLQTNLPDSPWNAYDDQAFLQAIGGFRHDRETSQRGITVAGLLMFGSDEAIRSWRGRHLIDFRVVSEDVSERLDERWSDRVVWEGHLFGAFEAIYPRLVSRLPVPFALEDGWRVDQGPQHVALREAMINLLVHADYRERDASLMIRSEAGYFFRNPGSSRVLDPDLSATDRSDPRNPELVRMFRMIGLAEEAGTGIPKILRAWRALGYQPPDFGGDTERYEFSLRFRYAHLLSDDDRQWLAELEDDWSEPEQLALVTARHGGEIDNQTLRRLTGVHPADATKMLGSLRDRGLLQMIGGGRGAWYRLAPAIADSSAGFGASLPGIPPNIEGIEASLQGFSPSLQDSPPSIADLDGHPEVLPDAHDETRAELQRIAAPMQGRRHPDPAMRDDVIVQLCAVTPLTIRELADLTGRHQTYLRQITRDLLVAGRIQHLYPEQPKHPRQRYIARPDARG